MPKAQLRAHSPTPTPMTTPKRLSREARDASPRPSSVLEDGDGDSIMTTSRPTSLALMPPAATAPAVPISSPPSLRDILTNTAPPPFTLGAFTAFLSQNHCMETLEFTMDADRYRSVHSNFFGEQGAPAAEPPSAESHEHVCSLWRKIINAYIVQYSHREVNLPAPIRDRLLSLPSSPVPPDPSELDEAVKIVYELMNDSVLGPFLASMTAQDEDAGETEMVDAHDAAHHDSNRQSRSRLRMPRDPSASSDESSRSPKMGFLPILNMSWTSEPKSSASSSSDTTERGALTDDGANTPSPTGNEPMTPPTTPPMTDWGFSTASGGLHKALSTHSSGWKKMGAKLGLNRMGRSKRGHSSAATSAPVVDVVELQAMPIPNDTTAATATASLDSASPLAPPPREKRVRSRVERPHAHHREWEEPHPGQRYAITVWGNTRPAAGAAASPCCGNGGGVGRADTAAKAYSPYPVRSPSSRGGGAGTGAGARRFAPTRLRTPSSRHGGGKDSRAAAAAARFSCLSSTTTTHKTTYTNDYNSSLRLTMTDFSGFLHPELTPITTTTTEASSFTSLDPEKQHPITPDDDSSDDPYGWEAAMEKRAPLRPPPPCRVAHHHAGDDDDEDLSEEEVVSEFCPVLHLQYRRANGAPGKRTLLQRVLSFGPRE
ncbi:hypothetical protein C8A05DRAFT_35838 [Staphylotrichum tortipilum]|uniref:RGS domain-containing protein n=1 Tax=Staphylotrichum tortipilum TaxID=2831512 RepID=A0AAN6MGL7_9PEZI|nr:hypothetical protein C8A05DRAFT_35838 [Staphylotrichum longicolle]